MKRTQNTTINRLKTNARGLFPASFALHSL